MTRSRSSRRGFVVGAVAASGSGVVLAYAGPAAASSPATTRNAKPARDSGFEPNRAVGGDSEADTDVTADEPGNEVLYATSFEDASDAVWATASTAYDPAEAHTGQQSLRYARTDPASYVLAAATVPGARPGDRLAAGVWIKASGLSTAGALIALEWYDASDAWLGGRYTSGVAPADWTRLALPPGTVPDGTARVGVLLYLARECTGTAWFDDLSVERVPPEVLTAQLAAPAYRGLLWPGSDQSGIDLRLGIAAPPGHDAGEYQVRVDLADASGAAVDTRTLPGAPTIRYAWTGSRLGTGRYDLRARLTSTSGAPGSGKEADFTVRKLPSNAVPSGYVDGSGNLIERGRPVFPIGMYDGTTTVQNLADLAGAGFDTVMSYTPPDSATLDAAAAHGIRYLYSVKDFFADSPNRPPEIRTEADEVPFIIETVKRFRGHSALRGWYINDERHVDEQGARLLAHYRAVIENDPDHPAYSVDYQFVAGGAEDAVTDVFGTDIYPVVGRTGENLGGVGDLAAAVRRGFLNRAMWPVIQLHDLGNYGQGGTRPPNLVEVRNMSWQAIAAGANGLLYYSLFDIQRDSSGVPYSTLLGNAARVVGEISALARAILSPARTADVTMPDVAWLRWTARLYRGRRYVVAVNTGRADERLEFTVPRCSTLEVLGENRTIAASGGRFVDPIPALGVHLYAQSG